MANDLPVRVSLPLKMHPSMLRATGPSADSAKVALAALYTTLAKMADMEKTSVDRDSLGRAAQPYATKAVATAGAAVERLTEQLASVKNEIAREIVSKPYSSPAIGAEIRAFYLADKSRLGKLNDVILAAGKGDDQARRIMSEVLLAPGFLSGLSAKDHAILQTATAKYVCPEACDRRDNIAASLDVLADATDEFTKIATKQINAWISKDTEVLAETFKL